jgi:hypothetical protein
VTVEQAQGPDETIYFDDPGRYLTEDPPYEHEQHVHRWLVGPGRPQPLLDWVCGLVRERDAERLTLLCEGRTPLHRLLTDEADPYSRAEADLGTPFDQSELTPAHALRGLAALGLALVGGEDKIEHHLRIGLRWLSAANISPKVSAPSDLPMRFTPSLQRRIAQHLRRRAGHGGERLGKALDRLAALEGSVSGGTATQQAAVATLCGLAGVLPKARRSSELIVLLSRGGSEGRVVTLRGTYAHGLPPGLAPDVRRMGLFGADAGFRSSLENAWSAVGEGRVGGTILWSLETTEGPLERVGDRSFGAGFTVLIDEIRRLRRRPFGPLTIRRLNPRTAVVGAIDPKGRLLSVGGYPEKLEALVGDTVTLGKYKDRRVVVPACDADRARAAAQGTEVLTAESWRDAAKSARRAEWKAIARNFAAVAVLVLVGAGVTVEHAAEGQQRAQYREVASRVAETATTLAERGNGDGTDLLLAMASDDIARDAGEHTDVFGQLAQDVSTLVGVVRPTRGVYRDSVLSPDGSYALLSTDAESVSMIDTTTARVVWSYDHGPGLTYPLAQRVVRTSALAFADDSTHAAYATSDRKITLLALQNDSWSVSAVLPLPVASHWGVFAQLNSPSELSFSPDGRMLAAYSPRIGLYMYDLRSGSAPPRHCAIPTDPARDQPLDDNIPMHATDEGAVVVHAHEVLAVRWRDCMITRPLTVSKTIMLGTAHLGPGSKVTAIGTRGRQLLLDGTGGEKVLDNDGPYYNPQLLSEDDALHLIANTSTQTYGWSIPDGTMEFELKTLSTVLSPRGPILQLQAGKAEIHTLGSGTFTRLHVFHNIAPITVRWAAHDLIVGEYYRGFMIPQAAGPDPAQPTPLSYPGGQVQGLAADPTGHWLAGVIRIGGKTPRRLLIWDLSTVQTVRVPVIADSPNTVGFLGQRLFVGYRGGALRTFVYDHGTWRQDRQWMLPSNVLALATDQRSSRVVAVTTQSVAGPPTVHTIDPRTLRVTASQTLAAPTGLPVAAALSDGQVVVAYGNGTIEFLGPDLRRRKRISVPRLEAITGVTELPARKEVIVTGVRRSVTIDTASRVVVSSGTWGRAGTVSAADTSPDGRNLVTANFNRGEITVWVLDDDNLRRRACAAIRRDLTLDEWHRFVGHEVPYHPVCADYR